jgi:ferredoxin
MFDSCLKCGVCYENCYLEKIGIPSFVRLLFNDDTAGSLTCSNCWTCQDVCPADLPLMDLRREMRGNVDPSPMYDAALANILKCGYCFPIYPEDINSFRTDDGLDPLTLASPATIAFLLQNE